MGKLVIVISAGVTAFIMALTAGAVYAYRTMSAGNVASQQPSSASQASPMVQVAADATQAPTPTVIPNVSPQDAASIASKAISRTDVYSVALGDVKGQQAYMVTFSSGDVVYVAMQGQVLQTLPPPAPVTVFSASSGGGGGGGGSSGGGHHSGGEHESEHEGGGD
jgi:uncharacterized membrane protein YgcG